MRNVQWKAGTVVVAILVVLWLAACGPAALEEKRLADECSAVYGFNTPEARACWDVGTERLAMRDH